MKRIALVILLAAASLCSRAQIAETWIAMPDSVCPFLSEQQRLSMLQYAKAGLADTIVNQFDGKTYFDSINLPENYISVQVTANMKMEISLEKGNIRIKQTVCAPICSTVTAWYDQAWNMLRREKEPWDIEQTEEERRQLF